MDFITEPPKSSSKKSLPIGSLQGVGFVGSCIILLIGLVGSIHYSEAWGGLFMLLGCVLLMASPFLSKESILSDDANKLITRILNFETIYVIIAIIIVSAIVFFVYLFINGQGEVPIVLMLAILGMVGIARSARKKSPSFNPNRPYNPFDNYNNEYSDNNNDFDPYSPYIYLAAYIMKSDNVISRTENRFVTSQLRKMFGASSLIANTSMINDLFKVHIDVEKYCRKIRNNLFFGQDRKTVLYNLFALAACDEGYTTNEENALREVAKHLNLSEDQFNAIAASFTRREAFEKAQQEAEEKAQQAYYFNGYDAKLARAYNVLEISSDVSNDQLRDHYRALAKQFHPDRVTHLGEDFVRQSNERFQAINEAYEIVKEHRNIK